MNKYKVFKNECLRLQKEFGLQECALLFHLKMNNDDKFFGASIEANLENYQADVYFDTKWHKDKDISEAKQSARHEMIHLVLRRLYIVGRARYIAVAEIDEAEEALTRKLEYLFFRSRQNIN